jgi:membrane fusion protein (multidrug efflux system)
LMDLSRVRVAFGVPDTVVGTLKSGQELSAVCDALGGQRFAGRVSKIAAAADPGTRTFLVEVTIDKPDGLRPGMVVTVSIGQRSSGTLLPMTAIQRGKTKSDFVVYQLIAERDRQIVRRKNVQLGGVYDNRIQVLPGPQTQVKQGDTIVVNGAWRLEDGQAVRVLEEEARKTSI